MLTIAMRTASWTFNSRPYVRTMTPESRKSHDVRAQNGQAPELYHKRFLVLDTFDLGFNLRGVGWCWSTGLRLPQETRPVDSPPAFVAHVVRSLLLNALWFDALLFTVQSFSPATIGSPAGGSIFDPSLPTVLRYLRSTIITGLSGLGVCAAIDASYQALTLFGVLVLRQHPRQWPPIADAPWAATSLTELWSRRWHQVYRVSMSNVQSTQEQRTNR
jgi:hypothetical protein